MARGATMQESERDGQCGPEYRDEAVSEVLAKMTGRDASEFEVGDEVEYPHPDDLESVGTDEW